MAPLCTGSGCGPEPLSPCGRGVGVRGAKRSFARCFAALPLTQLRLSSLALAKTSYPSPTRGEGVTRLRPHAIVGRLRVVVAARGARAIGRRAALPAVDRAVEPLLVEPVGLGIVVLGRRRLVGIARLVV